MTSYPRRKNARLREHDYSTAGAYFVTIVVARRIPLLGDIADGRVRLTPLGVAVSERWQAIAGMSAGLRLGALVVMPNHIHGVIVLTEAPAPPPIPRVVQSFKSITTNDYHRLVPRWAQSGPKLW